jgi:hypothetical protein
MQSGQLFDYKVIDKPLKHNDDRKCLERWYQGSLLNSGWWVGSAGHVHEKDIAPRVRKISTSLYFLSIDTFQAKYMN